MSDGWDDGDILRRVLAQSQQEYLDSLKRKAKEINTETSDRASSSGYNYCSNEINDESYASCSSTSDGSPNKKQKLNDEIKSKNDDERVTNGNCKEQSNAQSKTDHESNDKNDEIVNKVTINDSFDKSKEENFLKDNAETANVISNDNQSSNDVVKDVNDETVNKKSNTNQINESTS